MQPEQLEQAGYRMHVRLEHLKLVEFIKPYLFRANPVMLFYWGFNLLVLGLGIAYAWNDPLGWGILQWASLGILAFFLIIPVHELIHGIGYSLAGAQKVSYKAVWKQLIFYAMADRFVTRKKPFVALALAPFLLLNTVFAAGFFLCSGEWRWVLWGLLLFHTSGCAGDFALVSYFYEWWHKDPVTYDAVDSQESFFLHREEAV